MSDWSNEEFLDYVKWHSRTERAAFCGAHIKRLFALAGRSAPADVTDRHFLSVRSDVADQLIAEAKARLS